MSINFTGYKNTGYMNINTTSGEKTGQIFTTQLMDDDNGNHLSEFSKAIEKSEFKSDYKKWGDFPGMISLYIINDNHEDNPTYNFYLNGTELEQNDKNLPIYTYLAKLTRNISAEKKNNIILDKKFPESIDLRLGILPGIDFKTYLERTLKLNYTNTINDILYPGNAIKGAKNINKSISEAMLNYFT